MKRALCLLLVLGLLLPLGGDTLLAPTAAHARGKAPPVFLWQVDAGGARVYLLGSIHVGSRDTYPLDPRIERAFGRSDTLVLEVPMDDNTMKRGAAAMQAAAAYTPPDRLGKHLDAATQKKLDVALGGLGIPAALAQLLKPWMVALTLTITKMAKLGYQTELGIDMHFHRAAVKRKMRIAALETLEEQLEMLAGMPESTQLEMLRQTIDELDTVGDVMKDAYGAWKRGDVKAIRAKLVDPTRKSHPKLHRRMLTERNQRMTGKIIERLKAGKGTTFVVVGSAHLVGDDSIVAMLNKRGYRAVQQ